MSETYLKVGGLQVARSLHDFIVSEALPGSGIDPEAFWTGFESIFTRFAPRNAELLQIREDMQSAIDGFHKQSTTHDPVAYRALLEELAYLVPEGDPFTVTTANVDDEVALIPGPQLVVPVNNARYAINAANARWGSLYDALYGTDAMGDSPEPGPYSDARGARVIAWSKQFLDSAVPLAGASHADVVAYRVVDNQLSAELGDGSVVGLASPNAFTGYNGPPEAPTSVLLTNNGLGIDLVVDRTHNVGSADSAGVADVVLESAMTAIMDCEDSVAVVDAEDAVLAYHNWLGLMKGDLAEEVTKGGETFMRTMNPDRNYIAPDGSQFSKSGRALLWVRNVGHLVTTPALLDSEGNELPAGLLESVVTVLCAMHSTTNSAHGSIYVVKPKMHGPEEVAFANEVFLAVEEMLGLAPNTVKLGLMDEERRTSVNLKECIRAISGRIAFINTGFLDRTGDELHTSMHAGAMVPKAEMKAQSWISAYEDLNVDIGLECGLSGVGQIGKGMWAAPDDMAGLIEQKIGHPKSGANCAWVPSPTGATLHATHYHQIDVMELQQTMKGQRRATVDELLVLPLAQSDLSEEVVRLELENNAQGILGYVVRWIDQGVGCSKVPDINDVGLMEDKATCRISSQHMANWLNSGVVTVDQVKAVMEKMAVVVDGQNAADPLYKPMAPGFDGHAYKAALDLVLSGIEQPSGYTEPILHSRRRLVKAES